MVKINDNVSAEIIDGVLTADLSTWDEFANFVTGRLLDYDNYNWRGQRSADWLLESTLDRMLKETKKTANSVPKHLENFKYATRGRRGSNPAKMESDDDWWALGQHNGLATPLLDWTTSPFVAAYFAFWEDINEQDKRAIYGLTQKSIVLKNGELVSNNPRTSEDDLVVKYIKPLSDENARLVNQSGLFTKSPTGIDMEKWVSENFSGYRKIILLKLTLPNTERATTLKALNRMNINHLTLFPDLSGASEFCNMGLKIEKYKY
ncbi:FRG domain-containing protein [Desulfosporosinus sp. OT]|uniref:FRG domain-containing protein n=1 Tax=Desulfosporosinus sp. OT TaxID=913865 RepID=UPI0002239D9D|nr:FRG domain-containing protein [Desulfosporosinus sp. OT]EGW36012.1 FRG domain protein [Desulfosporosinus sp. OT]